MTAPNGPRVRLVAGGDIATVQSWSTSVSVPNPGATVSQAQLQALVGAWRAAWESAWSAAAPNGIRTINTTDTRLFRYRAYLYGFNGGPAILQAGEDRPTPLTGNSSTVVPTQTALVATLLTGLPGRSFRGRMYLPATGIGLGSNHQIAQVNATGIATAVAGILTGLNSFTSGGPFGPASVAGLQGVVPVTSVRVDSEPDVQRRRADKILAAFQGIANV